MAPPEMVWSNLRKNARIRWLSALLTIAAATSALFVQACYWDNHPLELLAPVFVLALPIFLLMFLLYSRPLWQRPVKMIRDATWSGKCRWLFIATVLMNTTTIIFWVRSCSREEVIVWFENWGRNATGLMVHSAVGTVQVQLSLALNVNVATMSPQHFAYISTFDASLRPSLGTFLFRTGPQSVFLGIPHLALVLFFTIPVTCAVGLKIFRSARDRTPICRQCSYNLTGNTSGVCPECGTAINAIAESPPTP